MYCLNPTTTSCADLLHAITGSPDPMDTLSYNILQCFILFSNIQAFFVAEQQKLLSAVAGATTIFSHLTEAGMLSCSNKYSPTSQRQVLAALLLRYPTLFSGILGKYPPWFVNPAMTDDAMSSTVLCRPYLVSLHCD